MGEVAGRYDDVDAYYATRSARRGNPHDAWIGALTAARLGRRADAERLRARMLSRPWPITRSHFQQAGISAVLGEREQALAILREEPHRGSLAGWIHTSQDFASLRDDPFVAALLGPARSR